VFEFIRNPFKGRGPYEPKRATQEAIARADYAHMLLHSPAFHDSYQCEIDILVDAMLDIEPVTADLEKQVLRIHARIRELQNLIQHLKSFANQKKVIEMQDEAA